MPFPIVIAAALTALSLDLPGAVAYALKHDPALLQQHAQVAQAESTYAKMHAAEFPSLGGSLQSQLQKNQNLEGDLAQYGIFPSSEFSLNTAQITSNWTLWDGGYTQLQAQKAKKEMTAAELDYRRAEDKKALDIATAFYGLANKRNAVALAAADRAYQQALLEIAQANEKVGRVAGVDVLRAQSSEARSESVLAGARSDAENASEDLAQMIGAPLDSEFLIPGQLPEPPLPAMPLAQMIATAETSRPDVAAASANVGAAIAADRSLFTDYSPKFQINGAFGNQFSPTAYGAALAETEQLNPLYQSVGLPQVPLPTRGNPGFWQIGATATLAFPIADWGTRHAAHRAALEQINAMAAALDAAKRTVERDVRTNARTAEAASVSLSYAKIAASSGAESARIAQLQYRGGLISFADVRSAEQQALSAQDDLANAHATYLLSLIRLRVALGTYDPVLAVSL